MARRLPGATVEVLGAVRRRPRAFDDDPRQAAMMYTSGDVFLEEMNDVGIRCGVHANVLGDVRIGTSLEGERQPVTVSPRRDRCSA